MTLSTPYAKVRQVLVVKQDAAFQNIADLSGAAMGVVEGSAAQAAMDGTEEFSASLQGITLFGTVEELVSALEAGTVQVAAMDETAARYSILQGKAYRMISTSCLLYTSYTSERAEEKVAQLLRKVSLYAGHMTMYVVPFTEIQEQLREKCPEELFTILMRRFMMRIAQRIAVRTNCQALVTGESLGVKTVQQSS